MREIKFRAWGTSGKSMIPAKSICRIHFSEGIPYCILMWNGNILIHGEVNLMQYTGLRDKDNKEIYEGDIVKCRDLDLVVKWDEKLCGFTLSGIFFQNYFPSEMEKIGNIYENPDLLKGD